MKIDGREISTQILDNLKLRVEKLKEKNVIPHLYIILLSTDDSSQSYVKQKELKAEYIGIKITIDKESLNINTDELLNKIEKLNLDNAVHGIIVQRPMPQDLDEEKIRKAVIPTKDVDGFNPNSKFKIPVSLAILKILNFVHPNNFETWLKQQRITILGKGLTAGNPIINTLIKLNITPEVITSNTIKRQEKLKNSDIIISAVGKPNIIKPTELKQNVILVGVGIHKNIDGKFSGDYNEEEIQNIASFYSPTPGGVGPINVSMLLSNVVEASENLSK